MSELLPCPFCGGDDVNMGVRPHFREGKGNGWTVLCADCGGSIGYIERPDGHFYAEYDTKSEAIAAWNSRAERICKMETDHDELEVIAYSHEDTWAYKCSSCDWSFRYDRGIKPNYCPNCGRRCI